MAPQANLTENDQRVLNEPYNPIYNLIPVAPVIVKQYVTPKLTVEAQEIWMLITILELLLWPCSLFGETYLWFSPV